MPLYLELKANTWFNFDFQIISQFPFWAPESDFWPVAAFKVPAKCVLVSLWGQCNGAVSLRALEKISSASATSSKVTLAWLLCKGGIGPQRHEACNKLKKEGTSDKFESSTPIPIPKLYVKFWWPLFLGIFSGWSNYLRWMFEQYSATFILYDPCSCAHVKHSWSWNKKSSFMVFVFVVSQTMPGPVKESLFSVSICFMLS